MTPHIKPQKIAVLMFSLGAPEKLESVRPFLTNLFNDPAIISLPSPLRQILSYVIAKRRTPEASEIYAHMGGGSPLLPNTQKQADALHALLQNRYRDSQIKCLPVMRYWHPRAAQIAKELEEWQPDTIVFLPMYPQFSTTTNRSSMKEMHEELNKKNIKSSRKIICCFPDEDGFIKAAVDSILPLIREAREKGYHTPRLLLSAHGVPKNIINKRGDPYLEHCKASASRIVDSLGSEIQDSLLCFQSKVGPLEWLKPYTEDVIRAAGKENKALIVFPLAFVLEHSETLVELDIEYGELAEEAGVPLYLRAPAVAEHEHFIQGLEKLVAIALEHSIIDRNEEHSITDRNDTIRPICTIKHRNLTCPKTRDNCCPLDEWSEKFLNP